MTKAGHGTTISISKSMVKMKAGVLLYSLVKKVMLLLLQAESGMLGVPKGTVKKRETNMQAAVRDFALSLVPLPPVA